MVWRCAEDMVENVKSVESSRWESLAGSLSQAVTIKAPKKSRIQGLREQANAAAARSQRCFGVHAVDLPDKDAPDCGGPLALQYMQPPIRAAVAVQDHRNISGRQWTAEVHCIRGKAPCCDTTLHVSGLSRWCTASSPSIRKAERCSRSLLEYLPVLYLC